ncbi:MAG TPA: flagellin lysine-N-methylase, partial [Myxococcaceae bacterium]|nr:flagellin lysine-N-methylase [Myxococcaceae bacterium]
MPSEPLTLRYMTRFRCLAERCEDTCCSGLRVPVSEAHWQHLRATAAGLTHLVPNPGGAPSAHAFIEMRPDGHCPYLDAERLCSLQREHGASLLPEACATFPRIVSRWGERVEVTGTLACPEVARQCLLAEDAVEPVPGRKDQIPRPEAARRLSVDAEDAHGFHAETVRAAALRLLHRREHPLSSRLAMLGHLAWRLNGREARARAEELLADTLQRFDSDSAREALHRGFAALELPGGPGVGLFTSVLKARVAAGRGERFSTLVRGVLESLRLSGDGPADLDAAWHTYAERWRHLETLHHERVHRYFHNYCLHQLWRSPLIDSPGLLAYVLRLSFRVGLLRLVLAGHPLVAAPGLDSEQLDKAAVETFQLVAKHVEQAPEVLSLTEQLAGAGGAETLGKVLVF